MWTQNFNIDAKCPIDVAERITSLPSTALAIKDSSMAAREAYIVKQTCDTIS